VEWHAADRATEVMAVVSAETFGRGEKIWDGRSLYATSTL